MGSVIIKRGLSQSVFGDSLRVDGELLAGWYDSTASLVFIMPMERHGPPLSRTKRPTFLLLQLEGIIS